MKTYKNGTHLETSDEIYLKRNIKITYLLSLKVKSKKKKFILKIESLEVFLQKYQDLLLFFHYKLQRFHF